MKNSEAATQILGVRNQVTTLLGRGTGGDFWVFMFCFLIWVVLTHCVPLEKTLQAMYLRSVRFSVCVCVCVILPLRGRWLLVF